ncbi:MAG TPA: hypothetical protein VIE12_05315 [Actinomycetota bacterium]|jgi:hypothetical protein
MTDAKQAWGEVGEKFSSWGRRVADRYHEQGSAGTAKVDADEAEREMTRAMKELFDELAKGVSAVGATLKDREANKELSDAVSAIGDAITATVGEATDAIRSKGNPPAAPPPPPAEG